MLRRQKDKRKSFGEKKSFRFFQWEKRKEQLSNAVEKAKVIWRRGKLSLLGLSVGSSLAIIGKQAKMPKEILGLAIVVSALSAFHLWIIMMEEMEGI